MFKMFLSISILFKKFKKEISAFSSSFDIILFSEDKKSNFVIFKKN